MYDQNKNDKDFWNTVVMITVIGVLLIRFFLVTADMGADTKNVKNIAPTTVAPSLPGKPCLFQSRNLPLRQPLLCHHNNTKITADRKSKFLIAIYAENILSQ